MNHIHYLSDNLTICQKPQRLGYDFVVQGTRPDDESCKVCSDLLFTHNLREFEREQRSTVMYLPPTQPEEDGSFTKGLMVGIVLGLILWLLIYIIARVTF